MREDARLIVLLASRRELTVELSTTRTPLTIGRSPRADVVLPDDPAVSGLHAILEWVGAAWTLSDPGLSRNGTWLGGEPLAGRKVLRSGDRIRIGNTYLRFDEVDAEPMPATNASGIRIGAYDLSDAETAVLIELVRPFKFGSEFVSAPSNEDIARALTVSVSSVKAHLNTLYAFFGIHDATPYAKRAMLARLALAEGIVTWRQL